MVEELGLWPLGPDQHFPPPAPASVTSSAVMSTAIMAALLLFKHQKVGDRVVGGWGKGVALLLSPCTALPPRVYSCLSSWGSSPG